MSVAAVSAASTLLGTASATGANPSAVNDTQPFAKLIEQPGADGKSSEKQTASSPGGEETDTQNESGTTESSGNAEAHAEQDDQVTEAGGTDLLAEIEAMVAAAGQIIVVPQTIAPTMPVPPTKIATAQSEGAGRAASVTPTILPTLVPVSAPMATATPTVEADATASIPVGQTGAPLPSADAVSDGTPNIAALLAKGTSDPVAAPGSSNIASIVAALKSSVAKVEIEDAGNAAPAPAAPILTASAEVPEVTAFTTIAPLTMPVEAAGGAPSAETIIAPTSDAIEAIEADAGTPAGGDLPVADDAAESRSQTAQVAIKPLTIDNAAPASDQAAIAQAAQPGNIAATEGLASSARGRTETGEPQLQHEDRPIDADSGADATSALITGALAPATSQASPVDRAALDDIAASATATLADQTIDRQIDLARDSQWLDRLARDISQAAAQQGQLKFHLNPEHLGTLQIELSNSSAGTSIRMTADNDQARAIIADAQPRLLAEVRAQGVRIAESQVDLNNQQHSSGGHGQPAGGQMAGDQQRRSSEDHKPFSSTPTNQREVAGDSGTRDDGELYA